MPLHGSSQLLTPASQPSLLFNTDTRAPSKLPSFNHPLSLNRSTKLSPSFLLRSKFAHFNHDLLLPRCLQKSLTKKFTLFPLDRLNLKSQSAFKLKNHFKLQEQPFDQPHFTDDDNLTQQTLALTHTCKMRLSLEQNAHHEENKQNTNYQNQLAHMMITKSKMKYTPQDTLRQTKSKWASKSTNCNEKNIQHAQQSFMSRTNAMMNFTKHSIERRPRFSSKQPQPLLNSTRTKLFCQIENISIEKLTKKDIFPLEKLIQKRSHKTSFRNKWFTAKTLQNQLTQD